MSDSNLHDYSHAQAPRDPNVLPTDEEREAEEIRHREAAEKEIEKSHKERQIRTAETANDLAKSNRNLTLAVAIFTAVAAAGTLYQGLMNRRSWETAQNTLFQMQRDSRESGEQFQVQLRHYDDGLGRTGLLATHAGEQATAGSRAAIAAKSSANTAKEALQVSERAYLSIGSPVLDIEEKLIKFPVLNIGRLSTFDGHYDIYNFVMDIPNPTSLVIQSCVRSNKSMTKISPTIGATLHFISPKLDKISYETGKQKILVFGTITYKDGFPDTPIREEPMCYESKFNSILKLPLLLECDPSIYLPLKKTSICVENPQ